MNEPSALSGPLAEFLGEQIPKLAAKAHRLHSPIPAEDYEQAMWVKAISGVDRLRCLYGQGHYGLIITKLRDACRILTANDRRYRLAVRAAQNGYSVYDIEFYSGLMLAHLLPVLVEAEFDVGQAMDKAAAATDAAGIHIRTDDPFGGAENYLVVLVDVTTAFAKLPEGMQRLLRTYYGVNQEEGEEGRWAREGLASSMGLTGETLRKRVSRALQRLQDELGGADPWK